VLGGVLALGLLIPAYDLMLIFLVHSVVVIVPLMLVKRFRARARGKTAKTRTWPQFSLLDLMLAAVVVAVLVAFAVSVPANVWDGWIANDFVAMFIIEALAGTAWQTFAFSAVAPWLVFGLIGVFFGFSTLAAACVGLRDGSLWARLVILCLIPTSVVMAGWILLMRVSGWLSEGNLRESSTPVEPAKGGTMRLAIKHLAKVGVVLLSLFVLVRLGRVYCALATPVAIPETTLPNPNGYDALIRAGEVLERITIPDTETATKAELEAFVGEYGDTLDSARAALDQEWRVPLEYAWSDIDTNRLSAVRALARSFANEGALAEMEARAADAVERYVDTIRVARASERGGTVIHRLFGVACENIGLAGLQGLRRRLTGEESSELVAVLLALDTSREPLKEVFHRDEIWSEHVYGWQSRLWHYFRRTTDETVLVLQAMEGSDHRVQAMIRLLICELAIQAYRSEYASAPRQLEDLVPDYLPAMPEDPFSGKPLVYRCTQEGYLLYSVGYNERDDGGQRPDPMDFFGGDMLLDEPPDDAEGE